MKFETILWKAHIPDQYAVAHLWLTICITEEKEVITINAKPFLRKLGAHLHPSLTVRLGIASPLCLEHGKKAMVKHPLGSFEISLAHCIA